MGLADRFNFKEIVAKGSEAIQRDEKSGSIIAHKRDGISIPMGLKKEEQLQFTDSKKRGKPVNPELLKKRKAPTPFGQKPIKGKQISPRYKSDWVDTDEFDTIPEGQSSFGGETAGYLEKPKYNEEELVKALDVKVDELIKKKKVEKGPFIKLEKYTDLRKKLDIEIKNVQDVRALLEDEISKNQTLETEIESLRVQLDSSELQRAAAENETQVANDRYAKLLDNFQQSLIKGTKEAIERVSLTAQVRGLQAQKETLKQQLDAQKQIVETLQQIEEQEEAQQAESAILRSLTGPPNSYEQQGDYAWKIPENNVKNQGQLDNDDIFHFTSLKKSHGWDNGNDLELYNFNSEKEVTFSIQIQKQSEGGHSSPWLGFSKMNGTIPARSGSEPGKTTLTAKKIRNVSSPKGRKKHFKDKWTLTIDGTQFVKYGRMYRKRRSGGSGN
jgi:hypothetical protein